MPRINQRVIRQCEQLLAHTVEQILRITVLKIRTPTAINQQSIAGKNPLARQKRQMPVRMPRREQRINPHTAHLKRNTFAQSHIRTGQTIHRRASDLTAGFAFQTQRRSHMIGVNMRIQGIRQCQTQLIEQRQITLPHRQNRIDQ